MAKQLSRFESLFIEEGPVLMLALMLYRNINVQNKGPLTDRKISS